MIIIDTSVFIDGIFIFDDRRCKIAEDVFRVIQSKGLSVVVPEVFRIELIGQLVRRMRKEDALNIYNEIASRIEVINIENLRELAFSIAYDTGCRAVDSYFIATAKITSSILITNDKVMASNARKAGVEAYFLIEEFDRAIKRLNEMK